MSFIGFNLLTSEPVSYQIDSCNSKENNRLVRIRSGSLKKYLLVGMALFMVMMLACASFAQTNDNANTTVNANSVAVTLGDGAVVNGGPPVPVLADSAGYPTSWGVYNNRQQILYTRPGTDGSTSVWAYEPVDRTRQLVENYAANAAWSPAGNAYVMWKPFIGKLYCLYIKADGTPLGHLYSTRINAYSESNNSIPCWATDNVIYYTTVRNGKSALMRFTLKTHINEQITPWCTTPSGLNPSFDSESGSVVITNNQVGMLILGFNPTGGLVNVNLELKEWSTPLRGARRWDRGYLVFDENAYYNWNGVDLVRIADGSHVVLSPDQSKVAFTSYRRGTGWYIMETPPEMPLIY